MNREERKTHTEKVFRLNCKGNLAYLRRNSKRARLASIFDPQWLQKVRSKGRCLEGVLEYESTSRLGKLWHENQSTTLHKSDTWRQQKGPETLKMKYARTAREAISITKSSTCDLRSCR